MPDPCRMTEPQPAVALTAAVRCAICGTVPAESMEEADKRAEQHLKITGHAATAITEAARRHDFSCHADDRIHAEDCECWCHELPEATA